MAIKTRTTRSSKSRAPTALERVNAYAQAVLYGTEVAGPHVRNACRRHFADLEHGHERGLRFDERSAAHVFKFFEDGLKLSDGQFDGKPFLLHPSQAFKLGSIFGWLKADGSRRFQTAYIEEGKGNGKSPFAGGVGLYGLTADAEPGAQIYACAAKKDQARILFSDACKMVRQSPALLKRLTFSGGIGKEFNIAHHRSSSFFLPISKEAGKTGSGPRPHFALADEVHEHPDRTIIEMLQRGFKFRRQPLLLMITNSGSDRNSVCWEERERAVRVAAGTQTPDDDFTYVGETWEGSDTVFAYVCSLDKDDDPMTDPSCWAKANPLLGTILKLTENNTYLLYLLSDTIFTWQFSHRQRPDWDARIDRFAQHLVNVARSSEAEEIVLVGHSSGSFLGAEILARALKLDPDLGRHGPRVVFLTLGGNMPIVGFHNAAVEFREHLRQLAVEPSIDWIDCQSRKDVMNFFPFDPISGHGIVIPDGLPQRNPLIVPVRFREVIKPEVYDRFRWQFFRVHFQFVMANQRPHTYDFFMIVCGPVSLRDRFRTPATDLTQSSAGNAPPQNARPRSNAEIAASRAASGSPEEPAVAEQSTRRIG